MNGINGVKGKTSFFPLNFSVPRRICPFWCYIVEVSQSNTGSALFLSSILQEGTLFSARPHSSSRVCRFLLTSHKWQLCSILDGSGYTGSERKREKGNIKRFIHALLCKDFQIAPLQVVQGEGGVGETLVEA